MKEIYGTSTPVMALRGISVFPQMVYSFDVGREKSIRALDEAMNGDQQMILLMQKDFTKLACWYISVRSSKCPATWYGFWWRVSAVFI